MLLNGGGIGKIQDITEAFSTAFTGREDDLRSLIEQLDMFIGHLNDQKDDIIAATESLNNLVGQFAAQKPVVDKALQTIPDALAVLKDQRDNLAEALAQLGKFSALAADSVNQTKEALVQELKDLGPVLESLADAGPALTRALSFLPTFPFPKETLTNWMRGDYANLTLIVDLTLSRIDHGFFTGTRWECDLTWLELQWGRTIGQTAQPVQPQRPATWRQPVGRCRTTGIRGHDMRLTRQIVIQLAIFALLAATALGDHGLRLHAAARDCSASASTGSPWSCRRPVGCTRGAMSPTAAPQVGIVKSVDLTDTGVAGGAVAGLGRQDPRRPRCRGAQRSPRSASSTCSCCRAAATGPMLKDGDVIPLDRTTVPPDVNAVLDATNRGLQAIPQDNLKTVVDEAYTAVGGLGPELSRLVNGGTSLAIDARKNLDPLTTLIDQSQAGAGFADRHRGRDPGVGVEPGDHHRSAAEPGRRRGRASWRRGPVRPTRCGRCSTGCSPRCRSCWPTWSASARSPSPTSRASSSCWCCCRRAPPSLRRSAWPTGTPSRTTRATT